MPAARRCSWSPATEGLILDPVYSGKAMAGLIDHVRQGRIGKGETVVFLHTGGTPALFAYADDLGLEARDLGRHRRRCRCCRSGRWPPG